MRYCLALLWSLLCFQFIGATNGVAVITQEHSWQQQLNTFSIGQFTFARLPITDGFGNQPSNIDDLIQHGATTIALQTENCAVEYSRVYHDLIDQAFQLKVEHHQEVQFYLEIGNEPDICGRDPLSYRAAAMDTVARLRPLVGYPNMHFVLGLGVHPEYNRTLLSNNTAANFDAVAYHMYGDNNLWDHSDIWSFWNDGELASYGKPILLTELGINGNIGDDIKAQRYRDFMSYAPTRQPLTIALGFWTLDPVYPNYAITSSMAAIMAGNNDQRCFTETNHCIHGAFKAFYESNGLEFGDPGVSPRESILLWGYPLTDEFVDPMTGYITQVFERMVFEWHPDNPDPYKVLLIRLGAQFYGSIPR